jgi:hypothetical protein
MDKLDIHTAIVSSYTTVAELLRRRIIVVKLLPLHITVIMLLRLYTVIVELLPLRIAVAKLQYTAISSRMQFGLCSTSCKRCTAVKDQCSRLRNRSFGQLHWFKQLVKSAVIRHQRIDSEGLPGC